MSRQSHANEVRRYIRMSQRQRAKRISVEVRVKRGEKIEGHENDRTPIVNFRAEDPRHDYPVNYLPVFPVEAYFIRRCPSVFDALMLFAEDDEPFVFAAPSPLPAGDMGGLLRIIGEKRAHDPALRRARKSIVDEIRAGLGPQGEDFDGAHRELVRLSGDGVASQALLHEVLAAEDPVTRARAEAALVLSRVLFYYRDPVLFMKVALPELYGGPNVFRSNFRFAFTVDEVIKVWGPLALMNPDVHAAVSCTPPTHIHVIMSRVNGTGLFLPGHRTKGRKDGASARTHRSKESRLAVTLVQKIVNAETPTSKRHEAIASLRALAKESFLDTSRAEPLIVREARQARQAKTARSAAGVAARIVAKFFRERATSSAIKGRMKRGGSQA